MSKDLSLTSPVRELRGIGPAAEEGLKKHSVYTIADLLDLFPRSYDDYSKPIPFCDAPEDAPAFFCASVCSPPERYTGKSGVKVLTFEAADENGERAQITLFNQPYLASRLRPGSAVYLHGTAIRKNGGTSFTAPRLMTSRPDKALSPVYPAVDGISQNKIRSAIRTALESVGIPEPHTDKFLTRFDLPDLKEAYRLVHMPENSEDKERGVKRFHADSCFTLARVLDAIAARREAANETAVSIPNLTKSFLKRLPFPPTDAQMRAMQQIEEDLGGPYCMNRLLQGDVGSGKTIVALFAAYAVMRAGFQAMMLVPTEVLAQQHFAVASKILPEDRVFVLTGRTPPREREKMLHTLRTHTGTLLIGTHALLYTDLDLPAPALLITDEQHRFGVRQRRKLLGEDEISMHSLTMSATPIPRSLALAVHGQTNVSSLNEMPPGRQPTRTSYVPTRKVPDMFRFIAQRAEKGAQAFVVCAAIEPGEVPVRAATEVYSMLKNDYPKVRFGLLHGRCAPEEKEQTMRAFQAGEIDVLVATTVIEVGVDVPNATVMAILDADRFGLAQLHQLRGRVGRGSGESFCFLTTASKNALKRIHILCTTNDGFRIAEEDLKERGAGEFLGERQHGQSGALSLLTEDNMEALAETRQILREMSTDPEYAEDFQWFTRRADQQMQAVLHELAFN